MNEIFKKLASLISNNVGAVHGPSKLGEIRETYLNSSKATQVLGWKPLVALDQGLEKTADYFRPIVLAGQNSPMNSVLTG